MLARRADGLTLDEVRAVSRDRGRFLLVASALILAFHGVDLLQAGGANWPALAVRLAWVLLLCFHVLCLRRGGLAAIGRMAAISSLGSALLYLLLTWITGRSGSPLLHFAFVLAMILPLILPERLDLGVASSALLVLGSLAILAQGGLAPGALLGWGLSGLLAFVTSGLLAAAYRRTQRSEREAARARAEALAANERLVAELREALAKVQTLSGLLPICAWCHKVRNDQGYWEQLEAYISARTEAEFSHGLCPGCYAEHFAPKR